MDRYRSYYRHLYTNKLESETVVSLTHRHKTDQKTSRSLILYHSEQREGSHKYFMRSKSALGGRFCRLIDCRGMTNRPGPPVSSRHNAIVVMVFSMQCVNGQFICTARWMMPIRNNRSVLICKVGSYRSIYTGMCDLFWLMHHIFHNKVTGSHESQVCQFVVTSRTEGDCLDFMLCYKFYWDYWENITLADQPS